MSSIHQLRKQPRARLFHVRCKSCFFPFAFVVLVPVKIKRSDITGLLQPSELGYVRRKSYCSFRRFLEQRDNV